MRALVEHLPIDSAYAAALDPHGHRHWRLTEQMLAQALHLLELQMYQQAEPKKRGPAPKPIPMPWDTPTRSTLSPAEMQARLVALRSEAQSRQN